MRRLLCNYDQVHLRRQRFWVEQLYPASVPRPAGGAGAPRQARQGVAGVGPWGQQRQPVILSGSKTRSTPGNQELTSLISSHPRWLLLALHGDFCTPSPMVGLMSGVLGLKWSCWGSLISHPGNLSCCSRGAQRTEQMLINPSWLYT